MAHSNPTAEYDQLFEQTAPTESVFDDKGALDPLKEPDRIISRDEQERRIATILNGALEGYLPPTVSIHGPPGTGKTLTTRRVCSAFAAQHEAVAVEYVNLKECRTIFGAANEIHAALTGTKKQAWEGLDGVFEGIWSALEGYPEWPVLLLDEIDQVRYDSNYDPNEFLYRLLRGEGKLQRGLNLSVWFLSNHVLDVDIQVDSRVKSSMSDETIFFESYDVPQLRALLEPRLEDAFVDGAIPTATKRYGVYQAALNWGDARKALTLFRQAGERANEREATTVTNADINACRLTTEKEEVLEKIRSLPPLHGLILRILTGYRDPTTGEIIQPIRTTQVAEFMEERSSSGLPPSDRLLREVITDLETMGFITTWVDAFREGGRGKKCETTFDPRWVQDAECNDNEAME